MEYKITRDTLQNNLLYDTLEALSKVMNDLQLDVYVVGALARDIAMEILEMPPSRRRTSDLDVAIALKDWSQFELLSENLLKNNFVKGKPKQRFYYKGVDGKNDYEIDIVPFGELEEDEKVAWPPEGNPEMPANGRTVNARELDKMLFGLLPYCVSSSLFYKNIDQKMLEEAIHLSEDQHMIRPLKTNSVRV